MISDTNIDSNSRIGIMAGSGSLPHEVVQGCVHHGIPYTVIGIEEHFSPSSSSEFKMYKPYMVSEIIGALHAAEVTHVVFAGKVGRSGISKLVFDPLGRKLLAKIVQAGFSDDNILRAIIGFFEEQGFKVISATDLLSETSVGASANTQPVTHTLSSPSAAALRDIERGVMILDDISRWDIGQSLAIQGEHVLGVEAAEGTDEMIKRCKALSYDNEIVPTLVKMAKKDQDMRVDMPCIGKSTISSLSASGFGGVAININNVIILDKQETIDLANELGVFIYAF